MNDMHAIEQCAAVWRGRRDDPDWTAQDQEALDAWLASSTAHRVAWLRMEYGWRRIDRLAALRAPAAKQTPRTPFRRLRVMSALAAALGVVAVGMLAFFYRADGAQRYATSVGGREAVMLADGSRLELNTDTELRAGFGKNAREVWLERGEAYFEIARDAARPFVVHVGERRIVVLGTRFSVQRNRERLQIAVADGRVRVEPQDSAREAAIVATRGELVIAQGHGSPKVIASAKRVDDGLAWRRGMLVFDNATLAEAVAEFNRYNRRQLAVHDPKIGNTRISGSFDAADPEAFVRLLSRAYGLRVEVRGGDLDIAE